MNTDLITTTRRAVEQRTGTIIGGRLARDGSTVPLRDRTSAQQSFAMTLGKRMDLPGALSSEASDTAARRAAEQLVSQSFVQPMLKLLRSSNSAAPPFAPGPAEKQFRSLMDTELAQRIVNSANFPLVDALTKRLEAHAAPRLPDMPVNLDLLR